MTNCCAAVTQDAAHTSMYKDPHIISNRSILLKIFTDNYIVNTV